MTLQLSVKADLSDRRLPPSGITSPSCRDAGRFALRCETCARNRCARHMALWRTRWCSFGLPTIRRQTCRRCERHCIGDDVARHARSAGHAAFMAQEIGSEMAGYSDVTESLDLLSNGEPHRIGIVAKPPNSPQACTVAPGSFHAGAHIPTTSIPRLPLHPVSTT